MMKKQYITPEMQMWRITTRARVLQELTEYGASLSAQDDAEDDDWPIDINPNSYATGGGGAGGDGL